MIYENTILYVANYYCTKIFFVCSNVAENDGTFKITYYKLVHEVKTYTKCSFSVHDRVDRVIPILLILILLINFLYLFPIRS